MILENPSVPLGTRLQDRYDILSELGVGSFGRVYKARQLSTGQDVAIKMLRLFEADTKADVQRYAERFQREMRLCATLSHPNIVRLIDSGESDDHRLYVVFDFVPGKTLRELLADEGPLAPVEALHLMTQVLDALSCAHAHGIVHRDVKPANIMVTRTGARRNALVLDFGLGGFSRHENVGGRLTATGEMLGTPCYAAPEQVRGESPSPRSDLYSWGLTFIECFTAEPAVAGSTAHEVLLNQLGTEPVPIPAAVPDRRLRRLLHAVTAKDVHRRDVTVASLLEALASIERGLSPTPAASERPIAEREGERRQLTFVSCRTVARRIDGTPLDVEDLDDVLHSEDALYGRIAGQLGGVVASSMADRLLLVFGYPRARENDARRAVRAAIQIADESRDSSAHWQAERDLTVAVHIGVHSGLAIVREHTQASAGTGLDIVGDPARLAARLDEAAHAGEILISDDASLLLRDEIACEAVGEIGVAGPGGVRVRRVTRERARAGSKPSVSRTDTPLVGRARELEQLLAVWQEITRGRPETILLSGEPGIGKSRLVRELRHRLPADAWLQTGCVAETQNSALQPFVTLFASISEPIDQLLARHGFDVAMTLPLFADLLSTPLPPGFAPLRLSPERQKEVTLQAIVSLLLRMAHGSGLIVAMEDLHWADPTTLELMGLLVQEMRAARIADAAEASRLGIVLTARPEFSPPWSLSDMTVISLDRLDRNAIEQLVSAEIGRDAVLPRRLVDHVVARTDGVPLFIEELCRMLAQSDMLRAGGPLDTRWESEIPGTLRELLTARMDQLSVSARDTLQIAATLGREFRYELLAAVTPQTDWSLREDLRELVDSRLIYPRRSTASETYIFKHSLVCDAAYESMVRARRRSVHARIVTTLQERFPETAQQQPDLVARHLEAGGDLQAAVEWWHTAGARMLRRAADSGAGPWRAYAEATQLLEHGLAVLERLPDSVERSRMEVKFLTTLGTVQFSTHGYSAPEVEETFTRAHALCEQLGQGVDHKVLSGIIGVHINRGARDATDALIPKFERLAESRDAVAAVTGLTTLGLNAFWRGAHASARGYLERACSAYLTDDFQRYARDYGYDGGIYSHAYVPWNLWALGYPVQANGAYEKLTELAERSFDPFSPPLALAFGVALAYSRREADETLARAERLIALSTEQKMYFWLTIGHFGRGGALTLRGEAEEGIPHIRLGLELARTIGAMTVYGYYLSFLAAAHLEAGQLDDGLAVVDEGLGLCAHDVARYHEPELLRLKGVLLERRGDLDSAERSLRQAVELARGREAKSWELRASSSLAGVLRTRGRAAEARAVLSGVYTSFTEGFDLADLREASSLLVELD
jgi:TOMM system kinase/cyclase fusion protein